MRRETTTNYKFKKADITKFRKVTQSSYELTA
jgi:hypothetical protein